MNSKQGNRYIKNRMGDDLKNKILEHSGIKIPDKQQQMVSRTCGSCGYVNKLENKFCEKVGCRYPLTQLALDEIKVAEQAKLRELVTVEMQTKDHELKELKEQIDELRSLYQDLIQRNTVVRNFTNTGIEYPENELLR